MDGLTFLAIYISLFQQSPFSSHCDSTLFSPFGDGAHVA